MNGKKVIIFLRAVRNVVITVLNQPWLLYVAVLVSLSFTSSIVFADEVKSFVSGKPWQVSIGVDEFEPWDLLGAKTILGGRAKDGTTITILTEITKPGTTASEVRGLYGQRSLEGFGQKETVEHLDVDGISVILFKLAKQDITDSHEPEKKQMAQKMF